MTTNFEVDRNEDMLPADPAQPEAFRKMGDDVARCGESPVTWHAVTVFLPIHADRTSCERQARIAATFTDDPKMWKLIGNIGTMLVEASILNMLREHASQQEAQNATHH